MVTVHTLAGCSSNTSITRIAGCYVDRDGDFNGSFPWH